jgi:hypothetical protein
VLLLAIVVRFAIVRVHSSKAPTTSLQQAWEMLRLDRRAMTVLAFAQLTDDVNQNCLPALLPF